MRTVWSLFKLHSAGRFTGFWRLGCALIVLAGGGAPGNPTLASVDGTTSLEAQVKGAFLIKFASFIEWPDAAATATNEPFRLGILGRDLFGPNFDAVVAKETVNRRPVQVERAGHPGGVQECQIVFVADAATDRLEAALIELADLPVLVVTDEPGAAERGSHINFFKLDGKVRFEFNLAAFERSRLRLSARLRQVGRVAVEATNAPPTALLSSKDSP